MPQPQPDLEWLPKRDAAQLLGVSERQIERRAAKGMIRSRREPRRPDQTAAQVLFSREDLAAIQAGTPNYHPVVENLPIDGTGAAVQAPESKAILPVRPAAEGMLLDRLAQLLVPPPPPPRPWLTLDEAAAFSGLPRPFLKQMAVAGRLDAVNVGSEARPRWRIRRAALEGPLPIASA